MLHKWRPESRAAARATASINHRRKRDSTVEIGVGINQAWMRRRRRSSRPHRQMVARDLQDVAAAGNARSKDIMRHVGPTSMAHVAVQH